MIKKINSANAGVKRPIRAGDFQDLWEGLNDALGKISNVNPVIISGFFDKGDGYLSAGVIAKGGILYFHSDTQTTRLAIGATAYGNQLTGKEPRVFEDSTTQDFAFHMVANTTVSGVSFGALTLQRVAQLRVANGKKEVNGRIVFGIEAGALLTVAFTADDDIGTGVVATGVISGNTLKISVKDADNVRMKPVFTILPMGTTEMLNSTMLPTLILSADAVQSEDIIFKWANIASVTQLFAYRVKVFFDV